MKKVSKKLQLNRETLRNLELKSVVGAGTFESPVTNPKYSFKCTDSIMCTGGCSTGDTCGGSNNCTTNVN